jgi:hypothetical protein
MKLFFSSTKNVVLLVLIALFQWALMDSKIDGQVFANSIQWLFTAWIGGKGLEYGLKK